MAAKKKVSAELPGDEDQQIGTPMVISISRPNQQHMDLTIEGTSPLIMHKFSAKAMKIMEAKQQGKQEAKARKVKVPQDEMEACSHVIDPDLPEKDRYGFPCSGLKMCAVNACRYIDKKVLNMTQAKGLFTVKGFLAPLKWSKITMRTDPVPIQGKTMDIRYRPEFQTPWSITMHIEYDGDLISPTTIANLYERAGFQVGIGDWRPQKGGQSGTFRVQRDE